MSPTGFPSYPTPLRCFPDGKPVHASDIKRVGGFFLVGSNDAVGGGSLLTESKHDCGWLCDTARSPVRLITSVSASQAMRLCTTWLVLLLLTSLLPTPLVAGDGLLPEVWLEAEFTDPHQATLELQVTTGGGLTGDPVPGTGAQLARPDFGVAELNRVARALTNDSGAFSAELLAGQLLFGHLRWQELAGSGDYQNSVDVREVVLYPNGFHIVLVLQLDSELPLELRPLYCLYDNHFLAGEMPAISGYELTLTTQGSSSFRSSGLHFNHLRWVRLAPDSTALETGVTFSSGELYLDPTELLGVGSRYDAQSDIIIIAEPAPQSSPLLMLILYALLCGSSWLLLRRNRECRLRFGIYRWLAVGMLFPLAFLPLSGPLFILATLFNAGWDAVLIVQARPYSRQHSSRAGALVPIDESRVEDGANRQLTGPVMPHERELLDELLDSAAPDALDTLDPAMAPLLGEQTDEVVLPDSELQKFPTASCPQCDAAVEERWRACPSCGGALGEEATVDAPASTTSLDDEILEARPVSMDVLLSSLKEDESADDSNSEETRESSDGMDDLRKKLESLNDD